MKDGTVKEYDLLESVFPNSTADLLLGERNAWHSGYTTYEFPVHELYGLKIEDISYIKLTGLDIWTHEGYSPVVVGEGYEVEIYTIEE